MQYFEYDEGHYLSGIVHADYNDDNPMPGNVTAVRPPNDIYRPKFDKTTQTWVETKPRPTEGYDPATEYPEWDSAANEWAIKPIPPPPEPEITAQDILAILLTRYGEIS